MIEPSISPSHNSASLFKIWERRIPEFLGEDRFVIGLLLGGLHTEMALWSTLCDLVLGSGRPESLKDAGIVNSLAAGMCLLKAVTVIITRYAHQVTTAVLDILRKKSFHQQWNIFIFRRMDFSFVGAIPNLQVLVTSSEVSERHIFIHSGKLRAWDQP